jgi:hypothetical protein
MAGRDSQADERKALSARRRASPGYDVRALTAVLRLGKGMKPAALTRPLALMTLTAGDRLLTAWRQALGVRDEVGALGAIFGLVICYEQPQGGDSARRASEGAGDRGARRCVECTGVGGGRGGVFLGFGRLAYVRG